MGCDIILTSSSSAGYADIAETVISKREELDAMENSSFYYGPRVSDYAK